MATPIFAITDGDIRVNLISKAGSGINVLDYKPARQDSKGGGVWADSSLSDGRQLQMRKFANAVDVITLGISGANQNKVIESARNLTMLLEKAVSYWTAEWQNSPVWIERRGSTETGTLYTLIHGYKWENDVNPFAPPFFVPGKPSAMTGIDLAIEHGAWMANPPGESECVPIISQSTVSSERDEFYPTQGTDDAFYSAGSLNNSFITLLMGTFKPTSYFHQDYDAGIRFRNVTVPQNALILQAYITFTSASTQAPRTYWIIYGENNATPDSFDTTFAERVRTFSSVPWSMSYSTWVEGYTYATPDIANIIQEIVNLGGWASGNDLVLFVEGNGETYSEPQDYRVVASFENETLAPPELTIVYAEEIVTSSEPTCEDEVYVANKDNLASIEYVYHYDDSAGTFSANLVNETGTYDLYPDPIEANDILYLGSSSPFSSMVLNLDSLEDSVFAIAFERDIGAGWVTTGYVTTDRNSLTTKFDVLGVSCFTWNQPLLWREVAVNGVTCYWVRFRVSSVTTAGSPPIQDGQIYTVAKSYVDIDEDDVGGDITALSKIDTVTVDTTRGKAEKIIISLRSKDRGVNFLQHINTGGQNSSYIAIVGDVDTSIQNNVDTPVGSTMQTAFAGTDAMARRLYFTISKPIAKEYYGRYRAFVRAQQTDGTVISNGDIQSYLNVSMGSSTRSKIVGNIGIGTDWHYFDYGIITIPPAVVPVVYEGNVRIDVYASNAAGAIDFDWVDLVLVPVDEYAIEVQQDANTVRTRYDVTTVDSVSMIGKTPVLSILRDETTDDIVDIPKVIASGPVQLQANVDQRLYFFVPDASKYEWLGRVQVSKNERYLTFRGRS
jgi:hypothetical protein